MSETKLCRLCVKGCTDYVSLYNETGQQNNLYEKTIKYFDPMFLNSDPVAGSAVLCLECCGHISVFYNFQQAVFQAQWKLLESEKEIELNNKTSEELILNNDDDSHVTVKQEDSISLPDLEMAEEFMFADNLSDEDNEVNSQTEQEATPLGEEIGQQEDILCISDTSESEKGIDSDDKRKRKQNTDEPISVNENTEEFGDKNDKFIIINLDTEQSEGHPLSTSDKSLAQKGNQPTTTIKPPQRSPAKDLDGVVAQWNPSLECVVCNKSLANYKLLSEHFRLEHPNMHANELIPQSENIEEFNEKDDTIIFNNLDNDLSLESEHDSDSDYIQPTTTTKSKRKRRRSQRSAPKDLDAVIDHSKPTLECVFCKKSLANFRSLSDHLRLEHPNMNEPIQYNEPIQPCENTEEFGDKAVTITANNLDDEQSLESEKGTESGLIQPIATMTPKDLDAVIAQWKPSLECVICTKSSANFQLLCLHFRNEHPSERSRMECCSRKFYTRVELTKHARFHSNPHKVKCNQCDSYFANKSALKRHTSTLHSSVDIEISDSIRNSISGIICALCKKSFAEFSLLKIHFRLEHPSEVCYASCCARKFRDKYSVEEHMQLHRDPNAFKCKQCGKRLTRFSNLKKHMRTHFLNSDQVPGSAVLCLECCGHISVFYNFQQVVFQAQSRLRESEKEFELQNKTSEELILNHEDKPHVSVKQEDSISLPDLELAEEFMFADNLLNDDNHVNLQTAIEQKPLCEEIGQQDTSKSEKASDSDVDQLTTALEGKRKQNTDEPIPVNENTEEFGDKNDKFIVIKLDTEQSEGHPLFTSDKSHAEKGIDSDDNQPTTTIKPPQRSPAKDLDGVVAQWNPSLECVVCNKSLANYKLLSEHSRLEHPNMHANELIPQSENTEDLDDKYDTIIVYNFDNEQLLESNYSSDSDYIQPTTKMKRKRKPNHKRTQRTPPKNHENRQKSSKPSFGCKVCKKSLANFKSLSEHLRLEHPNMHANEALPLSENTEELGDKDDTIIVNNSDNEQSLGSEKDSESESIQPAMKRKHKQNRTRKQRLLHEDVDAVIAQWKPRLECVLCKKFLKNFRSLSLHFLREHPNERCRVECCSRKFYKRCWVAHHARLHLNSDKVKCKQCDSYFATKFAANVHMSSVHFTANLSTHDKSDSEKGSGSDYIQPTTTMKRKQYRQHRPRTRPEDLDAVIAQWKPSLECVVCKKSFKNFQSLSLHFRLEHPNERCRVECCSSRLYARCYLVQHARIHLNPHKVKCKQCDSYFAKKGGLNRHRSSAHSTLNLHCYDKSESYDNQATLKRKFRRSQKSAPKDLDAVVAQSKPSLECVVCKKSLANFILLSEHLRLEHPNTHANEPIQPCENTEELGDKDDTIIINNSDNEQSLESENSRLQSDNIQVTTTTNVKCKKRTLPENFDAVIAQWKPSLECVLCKTSVANFELLSEHFRLEHPNEKCRVECCTRSFYFRSLLALHARIHLNPDKVKCKQCDSYFANKSALKRHTSTLHSSADIQISDSIRNSKSGILCVLCKKSFADFSLLKFHFRLEHPAEVCYASCCARKFSTKYALEEHMRLHRDPNAFKCKKCGKRMTRFLNLKKHMRTH